MQDNSFYLWNVILQYAQNVNFQDQHCVVKEQNKFTKALLWGILWYNLQETWPKFR